MDVKFFVFHAIARTQTETAGPVRDKVKKDGRTLHRAYLLHFNFFA
jgi:hypothetical protein